MYTMQYKYDGEGGAYFKVQRIYLNIFPKFKKKKKNCLQNTRNPSRLTQGRLRKQSPKKSRDGLYFGSSVLADGQRDAESIHSKPK